MKEKDLNKLLLEAFPELSDPFKDYTSWQDGIDTGCFLVFEDLLLPLIRKALSDNNAETIERAASFIEFLLSTNDNYAVNVATIGLIEGLKAKNGMSIYRHLRPKSKKVFDMLGS